MQQTPRSERIHIGFFGKRNAGKSSLLNAVTGQDLSVVSPVPGTTTDPVYKTMELLPLGPVVVIDTPGLDDHGDLGTQRMNKTREVLRKTDLALLVTDGTLGLTEEDRMLAALLEERTIPFLTVFTRADLVEHPVAQEEHSIWVSTKTGQNIHELKDLLPRLKPEPPPARHLVRDLISPGDFVVLVTPIDSAAPKGRLILPQQQTIRDVLETGAVSIVVREHELEKTLASLGKAPHLVITDSQAFHHVAKVTPEHIPLTSFSILFARYKGDLEAMVAGCGALDRLSAGDPILISEGCTHHRQCEDIGTVKLPRWIRERIGKEPQFVFTSGAEFPDDLSPYRLILHCGGCMLNGREMQHRLKAARTQGVPMTNYGILIAHTQGILKRSLSLFPELANLLVGS